MARLEAGVEEVEGEEKFSVGALQDVKPAGPAVENQAFAKQRVEEDEEGCEHDFGANAVGE